MKATWRVWSRYCGVVFFTFVLAATPSAGGAMAAEAQRAFLNDLAGTWQGSGTARRSAGARPEAIRCRVTSQLKDGGRRIVNVGNCAFGQGRVRVSGDLSLSQGSGRFRGSWFDTSGGSATNASGSLASRSTLVLAVRRYDERTNTMRDASIRIAMRGSSYQLTITEKDPVAGNRFQAANIRFRRR